MGNAQQKKKKYPDGKYYGALQHGARHGEGRFVGRDGSVYVGHWAHDSQTGQGKWTSAGVKYEGEWLTGLRHGHGRQETTNTPTSTAEDWEVLESNVDVYEGNFNYGEMHGKGTLTWADGNVYEGEFESGSATGKGILTYKDGRKYTGTVKDGVPHGEGKMQYPDTLVYEGEWKEGRRDGTGLIRFPDGRRQEGEWFEDNPVDFEIEPLVPRPPAEVRSGPYATNALETPLTNAAVPEPQSEPAQLQTRELPEQQPSNQSLSVPLPKPVELVQTPSRTSVESRSPTVSPRILLDEKEDPELPPLQLLYRNLVRAGEYKSANRVKRLLEPGADLGCDSNLFSEFVRWLLKRHPARTAGFLTNHACACMRAGRLQAPTTEDFEKVEDKEQFWEDLCRKANAVLFSSDSETNVTESAQITFAV